jgi:hypothetical protein
LFNSTQGGVSSETFLDSQFCPFNRAGGVGKFAGPVPDVQLPYGPKFLSSRDAASPGLSTIKSLSICCRPRIEDCFRESLFDWDGACADSSTATANCSRLCSGPHAVTVGQWSFSPVRNGTLRRCRSSCGPLFDGRPRLCLLRSSSRQPVIFPRGLWPAVLLLSSQHRLG